MTSRLIPALLALSVFWFSIPDRTSAGSQPGNGVVRYAGATELSNVVAHYADAIRRYEKFVEATQDFIASVQDGSVLLLEDEIRKELERLIFITKHYFDRSYTEERELIDYGISEDIIRAERRRLRGMLLTLNESLSTLGATAPLDVEIPPVQPDSLVLGERAIVATEQERVIVDIPLEIERNAILLDERIANLETAEDFAGLVFMVIQLGELTELFINYRTALANPDLIPGGYNATQLADASDAFRNAAIAFGAESVVEALGELGVHQSIKRVLVDKVGLSESVAESWADTMINVFSFGGQVISQSVNMLAAGFEAQEAQENAFLHSILAMQISAYAIAYEGSPELKRSSIEAFEFQKTLSGDIFGDGTGHLPLDQGDADAVNEVLSLGQQAIIQDALGNQEAAAALVATMLEGARLNNNIMPWDLVFDSEDYFSGLAYGGKDAAERAAILVIKHSSLADYAN